MLCIKLENTNPFFCLAAEEYLLKNFDEDIFMLWQIENTVVVGKHQNLLAEINYPFVLENNIKLARRISGGGTVFHDAGNVNFTYIKNVKSTAEISFRTFTEPVVAALSKLGVTATTSGRNDLIIDGKKISGNAEHVFKNRVLHHGTLLFNSDLKNLGQAIKVVPGKYESKAVQSNRSEVANISSFLKNKMEVQDFIHFMLNFQIENKENQYFQFGQSDVEAIEKLSVEKFKTWEWTFGYSPKYSFKNKVEINERGIEVNLKTSKGIIFEIKINGDYFSEKLNRQLSENLQGKKHLFEDVQKELYALVEDVPDKLVYGFF